jgi:hypothetical protein
LKTFVGRASLSFIVVKEAYPNRGVMLMDTNEATAEAWKGFYSSDWSNALQRPKLTITYWDPGS